jgi:hypothetical protein
MIMGKSSLPHENKYSKQLFYYIELSIDLLCDCCVTCFKRRIHRESTQELRSST